MAILLNQQYWPLIDSGKILFYYPNDKNLYSELQEIIRQVELPEKELFVSSFFQELYYEQEKRRQFIIGLLGINGIDRGDSEMFILYLNHKGLGAAQEFLSKLPGAPIITAPEKLSEVINEVKIFATVSTSIKNYFVEQIIKQRVFSLYTMIKSLSDQDKIALRDNILNFMRQINAASNPQELVVTRIPTAIEDIIDKLQLNPFYNKQETLGEKLNFLNLLFLIVTRQLVPDPNQEDAIAIRDIALVSYYNNPPKFLYFE